MRRSIPLYYFEADDGTHHAAGDSLLLEGPSAVREAVLASLPGMARDTMPNGDNRVLKVTATDETGSVVYSATLTLDGRWGKAA